LRGRKRINIILPLFEGEDQGGGEIMLTTMEKVISLCKRRGFVFCHFCPNL